MIEVTRDAGVLSVPGLSAAAVSVGIKPSGRLDVAVLASDAPRPIAAVFTRSQAAAAPVRVCREVLAKHRVVGAIVVNSGNANALTGAAGRDDAWAMVARTEGATSSPALVLSTGVIGVPLPIEAILGGIDVCSAGLRGGPEADADFAEAMRTTDTFTKRARAGVHVAALGREVTVAGTAKGSGMIHPDMATMLAVLATDAPIGADALDALLRGAVDQSFHEITVDGDTSTNDAVLLWAAPEGDEEALTPASDGWDALVAAVHAVARDLARQIVEDGEGMSRILAIEVRGVGTDAAARQVARAVATSSLVKTALAGGDPNWGRLVAAAANAGVPFATTAIDLDIGAQAVLRAGEIVGADPAALDAIFAAREVSVRFVLGAGPGCARVLTTDLTKDYVAINSEYTT